MISEKEVLEIHAILSEEFGGADGVRDMDLLDSALKRPYQTFDGTELYATLNIRTDQNQKFKFIIAISTGELNFDQIKEWLEQKVR